MACKYIYKGITYNSKEEFIEKVINPQFLSNQKVRRVIELQSDLFQKGRNSKTLTIEIETPVGRGQQFTYKGITYIDTENRTWKGFGEIISKSEYMKILQKATEESNQNQFLQLLNKDNNWVTFFVKSIIQDSSKKGYEKVLFPTGDTASKVEGHATLEEFKKQKEDEINRYTRMSERAFIAINTPEQLLKNGIYILGYSGITSENEEDFIKIVKDFKETIDRSLENYKQELERVEKEGFGALKPIYNFYENTITNILKKQGYNPVLITDEYGNTWNEVKITDALSSEFYFQKSDDTINKINETSKQINRVYVQEDSGVLQNEEDANNYYEINGKRIPNRVTDRVKAWYKKIFGNKQFTEEQKERSEILRTFGISGHSAFENIIDRYFDENGDKRNQSLPKPQVSPVEDDNAFKVYDKLEEYVVGLINQYPNSKFLTEKIIYDPNAKTDKGKGEAGTIDLLILTPDGDKYKADIYDWKFMGSNPKQPDIATFKQNGYSIQLERYRQILKSEYGIEKFGKIRAIPIIMKIGSKKQGNDTYSTLEGIGIGSVNPKEITAVKLVPIPALTERTDNPAINKLIDKLSALYEKTQEKKVKVDERESKKERLTILKNAIRQIQTTENMQPLLEAMKLHEQSLQQTVEVFNTKYRDKDLSVYSDIEVSDFAEDLNELQNLTDFYSNISTELHEIFQDGSDLVDEIILSQAKIKIYEDKLAGKNNNSAVLKLYAEKIAERNNVTDLSRPEKVIKGMDKIFRRLEDLPNKALNLLVNIYNKAKQRAIDSATDFNNELYEIIKEVNKGGGNQFEKLIKHDKHELISKYNPEFFKKLKTLKDKEREGFILQNTNFENYKIEAQKEIDKLTKKLEEEPNQHLDQEKEKKRRADKLDEIHAKYSLNVKTLQLNHILAENINSDWHSNEFKEVEKNPALLKFYDKLIELNRFAYDSGYIEFDQIWKFIPYMNDTSIKSLKDLRNIPIDFIDKLSVSEKTKFGYIDKVSGEKTYDIPKYFISPTENPSKQLGQTVLLYSQAVHKYKALSDVEEQIRLIYNIEKLKSHISTDRYNKVIFNDLGEPDVLPGNEENAKLFDNFTQYLLYGNKYPLSTDADAGFNKVINIVKRQINKTFGTKLEENTSSTSLIKVIDSLNRYFQIKTLGGNPISGMINWFGGNIQSLAQSGDYYAFKDFAKAETKLKRFRDPEHWGDKNEVYMKLLEEIKPLTEQSVYEMFKKSHSNPARRFSIIDDLFMVFMRKPEILMQAANFEAVMYNTMVHNGKLVNITDYVKGKDEYKNRHQSGVNRKEITKKMEEEISNLKNTKSLLKVSEVKDGKLVVPGLENSKEEFLKFSVLSQRIYRKITGGVADTAVNGAKLDVYLSSMMVFKNWMPQLFYTRFQGLQKVNDPIREENYDIGRIRLMLNILFDKAAGGALGIHNILSGNDKGVTALDHLYEKYADSYKKSTGQEFKMDVNDFKDMIVRNLSNQTKELGMMISFASALFALGYITPPDDDKDGKAKFAILRRTLDQFYSELSFYYLPTQWEDALNGSIFPAMGVFKDIGKFITATQKQLTGFDKQHPLMDAEEVREKAYPVKYGFKLVPGASAWLTYINLFSTDFAKEWGIAPPKDSYQK